MNVFFTLLCVVGLMGESQMLLLFWTSLGLNPLSVGILLLTSLELGLLGSAVEMMRVTSSSQVPACIGDRMQNNTKVASSAPMVYSLWLALRILGAYFTVLRTALWFLSQSIGGRLFLFPWHLRKVSEDGTPCIPAKTTSETVVNSSLTEVALSLQHCQAWRSLRGGGTGDRESPVMYLNWYGNGKELLGTDWHSLQQTAGVLWDLAAQSCLSLR